MPLAVRREQIAVPEKLLWIGGAAALVVFFGPQIMRWLSEKVGAAAAGIPIQAATGLVLGVGDAVGLPRTDVDKCQAHVDAGEWGSASVYCPTGTYLYEVGGAIIDTITGAQVGTAPPTDAPQIINVRVTDEIFAQWFAATGGAIPAHLPNQQTAALEWFNQYVAAPF